MLKIGNGGNGMESDLKCMASAGLAGERAIKITKSSLHGSVTRRIERQVRHNVTPCHG